VLDVSRFSAFANAKALSSPATRSAHVEMTTTAFRVLIHVLHHPEVGAKIGSKARRLSLDVPGALAHESGDAERGCA
jgi:hypothetical protein